MVLHLPAPGLSDCIEGDCHNGQGTRTIPGGGAYVGEFKDWLPNGQGTLTYVTDEETYEGEFKDNWKHGVGILTYNDGYQYVGKWKDGQRHGYGVESYPGIKDKAGYWVRDWYVGKDKPEEFAANPEK